jgi:beta-mannosidase
MNYIIGLLSCLLIGVSSQAQPFSLSLHKGWMFKEATATQWLPATVPGTVHTDLMRHKRIPDPFYRDNEAKVQWVAEKDWDYRLHFNITSAQLAVRHLELVFEGLDTYADIYLNGRLLLHADNMFRTWRLDVKPHLNPGKNELAIRFHNAAHHADSLARIALPLVRPSDNNRHYVRKAQYHFGWDWGPRLVTAGIWRKVSLQGWEDTIAEDLSWKSGLKKVALIQQPDSAGRSFYFKIDNQPVFMKGANWIPADVFLPRIGKEKYRQLLMAAKEANFNMLRVWGGGIYEDDAFYDLCDSLGIMVWQDFMFAGAMYPGDEHFMESVKQEVIDNIKRLRRHPCIVLWCGNNEMDEAWHNWGWQQQFKLTAADSTRLWQDYTRLFHELLPQLVKEHDGTRPYISTSPTHGWGRKQSMTEGDSHYWGVWWGLEPIEKYTEKIPRFMSEYGMQAMPDWETIKSFSQPQDRDTASVVMRAHQKHPTGYKTLATYLQQNDYHPTSFKGFGEATQELQARALTTAITAHINAAPYCMGTLFWQFNDCWPVSSWSVVDYYGRKKKAYHAVKKLYAKPVLKLPE